MERWKTKYHKYFRVTLFLSIVFILLFQGLVVRSNLRYGVRMEIAEDNKEFLVSPDQPKFDIRTSIGAPQTLQGRTYYAIGHTTPYQNDGFLDLLKVELSENLKSINSAVVIQQLPALPENRSYRGLYEFGGDLFTIASTSKIVNSSYSVVSSRVIQFDPNGTLIRQNPLPDEIVTERREIGYGTSHRILIRVNSSTIDYIFSPTYNRSNLTHLNYQTNTTSSEKIFMGYHYPHIFYDDQRLWLHYDGDPYDNKFNYENPNADHKDTHINSIHSLSYSNPSASFTMSIEIENVIQPGLVNIESSSITNTEITDPRYSRGELFGFVEGNNVFFPGFIQMGSNITNQAFYGFEVYTPTSKLFDAHKVLSLSASIALGTVSLFLRLQKPKHEKITKS